MKPITLIIILVIIIIIGGGIYYYYYNQEPKYPGRCGPDFDNQKCGPGQCCSKFGWCGGKNLSEGEHCAVGTKRQDILYDGPLKEEPGIFKKIFG